MNKIHGYGISINTITIGFSAILLSFLVFYIAGYMVPVEATPAAPAASAPRLLIVSDALAEADVLAEAAKEDVAVLHYDPRRATLAGLLADVRAALGGAKAASVGFATHDLGEAKFHLCGGETICLSSTLGSKEQRLFWRGLGAMVAPGGHIDLFACNLAATDNGIKLLVALESAAGVRFTASTDATGNPIAGGDWLLEAGGADLTASYFEPENLRRFTGLLVGYVAKIIIPDGLISVGDFGVIVSISGDTAIIRLEASGAWGSDAKLFVFERDNSSLNQWKYINEIKDHDISGEYDEFGEYNNSILLFEDYAIVGDTGEHHYNYTNLYYRHYPEYNSWGLLKTFEPLKQLYHYSSSYGVAVAMTNDTIMISDVHIETRYSNGIIYVYGRNQGGIDNWGLVTEIINPERIRWSYYGSNLSMSGDRAVVGSAWQHTPYGYDIRIGAVYIYDRNSGGPDKWGLVKKLTSPGNFDEIVGDQMITDKRSPDSKGSIYQIKNLRTTDGSFGCSVAIEDDWLVVGARNEDYGDCLRAGSVYVFKRDRGGPDNWGLAAKLNAPDAAEDSRFGRRVALSGDWAAIAAPGAEAVYLFRRDKGGADNWGFAAKLTVPDKDRKTEFGFAVGISGYNVIVGAPDCGGVYVFNIAVPTIANPRASGISNKATLGATVVDEGLFPIIERGVVWSASPKPTLEDNEGRAISPGRVGRFSITAGRLAPRTTYYYRGYATNSVGTSYTADGVFTTN